MLKFFISFKWNVCGKLLTVVLETEKNSCFTISFQFEQQLCQIGVFPPVVFLWSYILSKTQSEINWWTGQRLEKKGKMKRLVYNSQSHTVSCLFLQDYYPSTDFFQSSDPRWEIHSPSWSNMWFLLHESALFFSEKLNALLSYFLNSRLQKEDFK